MSNIVLYIIVGIVALTMFGVAFFYRPKRKILKIGDLIKNVKIKQEGITERQIFDCFDNPGLVDNAFGSQVFAREYGDKVLVIVVKDDIVIDTIFTKLANKLSFYKGNKDLNFYKIAFSATGDKSFYKASDNFEVYGKINSRNSREE